MTSRIILAIVLLAGAEPAIARAQAAPSPCPTSGPGGIVVTGASCVVFPPTATGAAAAGVNASVDHYALAPTTGASGRLVVFLNGSLGSPACAIVDPARNVYTSAIAAGDHVIGLSYRSNAIIGIQCNGNDGCFLPTRLSVVTGAFQPGAHPSLANIGPTEGIHQRLALALAYLAATRPADGWSTFLDAGGGVQWSKVIASGHSQGGGHAALLGKLHALARFVMLASACDAIGNAAASWLHADATWQTPPAQRAYGFSAPTTFDASGAPIGGDTSCPAHAAAWTALGLAPARRFDNAVTCSGSSAHGAPIACPINMPRVRSLFQP